MLFERRNRCVDENRLVADDLKRHARRQSPFDCFQLLLDRVDDLDRVRAGLSTHIERHGLLAVDHIPGARLAEAVLDAADVADPNWRTVDVCDDDVPELADGVDASQRANAQLGVAPNDSPAGDLDIFVCYCALKLADRYAVRVELFGVGEDSNLALASAGHADFADSVHGFKHALNLLIRNFSGLSQTLIAGDDY